MLWGSRTPEAKSVCFLATRSKDSWLDSAAAAELVKPDKRRNTVRKKDRNERRELGQEDLQIRQSRQREREFMTPRIH